MNDEELVWEEPPTDTHHKGTWKRRLAPLVDHPQKWARVRVYPVNKSAYAAAQAIREGRLKLPAEGQWEAVSRKIDGKHHLYVRYMGSDEA